MKIFLLLLLALIVLSGCAVNEVVLHPISQLDIARMPKGVSYTPDKDGYFLSDFYLSEVVKAKVQ